MNLQKAFLKSFQDNHDCTIVCFTIQPFSPFSIWSFPTAFTAWIKQPFALLIILLLCVLPMSTLGLNLYIIYLLYALHLMNIGIFHYVAIIKYKLFFVYYYHFHSLSIFFLMWQLNTTFVLFMLIFKQHWDFPYLGHLTFFCNSSADFDVNKILSVNCRWFKYYFFISSHSFPENTFMVCYNSLSEIISFCLTPFPIFILSVTLCCQIITVLLLYIYLVTFIFISTLFS